MGSLSKKEFICGDLKKCTLKFYIGSFKMPVGRFSLRFKILTQYDGIKSANILVQYAAPATCNFREN